jgi:hypothetical protein
MEVYWNEKLRLPHKEHFQRFLNRMSMRIAQGAARYGPPKQSQQFMRRLALELQAYKKTGNAEHLYNIANYAWLESLCPQNPRFHYDATVDSVTRGKV